MRTEDRNSHQHQTEHQSEDNHLDGELHGKARIGFIRKVFGIVCAELVFTALWVSLVYNSRALQRLVSGTFLGIIFGVTAFVGTLTLALSRSIARKVPLNYAILLAVTFSTAWSVSYLTIFFPASTILTAACATAAAVAGITWYAMTSNAQYNYGKAFLYSSLAILGFQLFAIFFLPVDAYNFWLSVLISISTSISILYHAESIIGKKQRKYSQDDYICAAMNLYIEIIQLFIEILRILDKLNKNKDEDDKKKKRNSN